MTNDEKLKLLKAMLGSDADYSDDILLAYLTVAENKIISIAYPLDFEKKKMPPRYDVLQCEIALVLLNKRGAEGQTQHSENGISRTYDDADIPKSLLRQITPMVKVL